MEEARIRMWFVLRRFLGLALRAILEGNGKIGDLMVRRVRGRSRGFVLFQQDARYCYV